MSTLRFYSLLATLAVLGAGGRAQSAPLRYEVSFRGAVIATQSVSIVQTDGQKTVATSFAADIPVFVAMHRYEEQMSVSFRPDGTVVRLAAVRSDGPVHVRVSGHLQTNDLLQIVRTGPEGVATSTLARADYDFHSLIFYGTAPGTFLPTNRPALVLSVAEGRVLPTDIEVIAESETFERQHLVSTHLVWRERAHTSHTWHPERFSNLPRRYVRQTENGEFTFTLLR